MSNWSSKGPCGCKFSFQQSKNTPDLDQLTKQEHNWFGSGVFLLGWNENLQPHGPLLDQFDTTGLSHHTSLICVCSHLHSSRHRERPRVDVFDMARLRLQAPVRRPNSRNMEPRNLLRIHDSLQLKYTGRTQVWWSSFHSTPDQLYMLWLVCMFVNQMVSPGWASVKFLSLKKWVWPVAGGGGTTGIHISSSAARGLQPRMVRAHCTFWSHIYSLAVVSVRFICDNHH